MISDDGPGTPFMVSHNKVDTHYYSPDTTQKEMRKMPLSFEFTSAQTIAEEQDRKQRFPVVTWCSDLELLGNAHAIQNLILKSAAASEQ